VHRHRCSRATNRSRYACMHYTRTRKRVGLRKLGLTCSVMSRRDVLIDFVPRTSRPAFIYPFRRGEERERGGKGESSVTRVLFYLNISLLLIKGDNSAALYAILFRNGRKMQFPLHFDKKSIHLRDDARANFSRFSQPRFINFSRSQALRYNISKR